MGGAHGLDIGPAVAPLTVRGGQSAGPQTLTGRSWSGHGRIDQVEVSFDGGGSWTLARLAKKNISFAWRQWRRPLEPASKGLDAADSVPFNSQGYLYWAAVNHPVTVV